MSTNIQPDYHELSEDYQRIEQALRFLQKNYRCQPSLNEIAASVGLSEFHFQRLFSRWVGISPKRFLQFLTKEHAKALLERSASILETTYRSGLSGPGRLHDLFVSCEAVTPGEYKHRGEGLVIRYGFHPSPFGECLLAVTDRGICGLHFLLDDRRSEMVDVLLQRWQKSKLIEDPQHTAPLMSSIFPISKTQAGEPLSLFLLGTNFQIKVWEALLRIPFGMVVSYQDIAHWIGLPKASRAVGQAVSINPTAWIIPCHRVIQRMGAYGNYRWGILRKQAMLGWEMAQGER